MRASSFSSRGRRCVIPWKVFLGIVGVALAVAVSGCGSDPTATLTVAGPTATPTLAGSPTATPTLIPTHGDGPTSAPTVTPTVKVMTSEVTPTQPPPASTEAAPPPVPTTTSALSWEMLTAEGPGARRDASLVHNEAGNSLLLFGGRQKGQGLNDLWVFDLATET